MSKDFRPSASCACGSAWHVTGTHRLCRLTIILVAAHLGRAAVVCLDVAFSVPLRLEGRCLRVFARRISALNAGAFLRSAEGDARCSSLWLFCSPLDGPDRLNTSRLWGGSLVTLEVGVFP